ncbi:hypothetical protein LIER_01584 [Lithospermum erythrorhizon]|uniref:F-box domain-containing protein n=1 Tax=Lithospermum erythrorhizon TaxID=34254 RepID=A0AAV3NLJ2_LITER
MADYLPLEMVQQVLLRLPIKPLLRCSTVCKAWYNMITSPQFIYAHLTLFKSLHDSTCLLIEYGYIKKKYVLYSDDKAGTFEELDRFEFPIEKSTSLLHVVGCCNGLICFSNVCSLNCISDGDTEQEVMLWNPIIRKSLHLPISKMQLRFDEAMDSNLRISPGAFGFVFDHIRNDYKVLRVYNWGEVPSMVEIFRLSTGLWEDISHKAPFNSISGRSLQVDLKGISHWIGKDYNGKLKIISFDVYEEVLGSIELPANVVNDDEIYEQDYEKYLFGFEESLFLIRRVNTGEVSDEDDDYNNRSFERKFDIWKMEEYNVVESWNQVETCVVDASVQPLAFLKNGEILWTVRGGGLISTSLHDASVHYLGRCHNDHPISCSYYVESLLLLDKTVPHWN